MWHRANKLHMNEIRHLPIIATIDQMIRVKKIGKETDMNCLPSNSKTHNHFKKKNLERPTNFPVR